MQRKKFIGKANSDGQELDSSSPLAPSLIYKVTFLGEIKVRFLGLCVENYEKSYSFLALKKQRLIFFLNLEYLLPQTKPEVLQ